MKVYRVENSDGFGPYWYADKTHTAWLLHKHNFSPDHPSPENSFESKDLTRFRLNSQDYVFGFMSQCQLFRWFSLEDLNTLKSYGFEIKEYLVHSDYIIKGLKQILFEKQKATKMER